MEANESAGELDEARVVCECLFISEAFVGAAGSSGPAPGGAGAPGSSGLVPGFWGSGSGRRVLRVAWGSGFSFRVQGFRGFGAERGVFGSWRRTRGLGVLAPGVGFWGLGARRGVLGFRRRAWGFGV